MKASHNLIFFAIMYSLKMVTRIESVITNASGVPSAISKCVPIVQNKKLHDSDNDTIASKG